MTSKERRDARYKRRKAARERRKQERCDALGGVEGVFTYSAMFFIGRKCCNGVRWKHSTQTFEMHLFSGTAVRRRKLLDGTWNPGKYVIFPVNERGKDRRIEAPRIQDRQIHKVYTQRVLLPLYLPDMIYNNGASLPGRGLKFAQAQLVKDLVAHFRKYGRDGFIILADYTKFFPTAPRATIMQRHDRLIRDDALREIGNKIINRIPGDFGVPLGVEPSQIEMVALPSPIDNRIKAQLRMKGAGHYMDDYNILVPPDRDPEQILDAMIEQSTEMGLHLGRAKTHVQPLTKPFKFCKAKYTISETGHITVNGCRESMKRARRKFRAFAEMLARGEMTMEAIEQSAGSTLAYFRSFDDNGRVLRLRKCFRDLFGVNLYHKKVRKQEEPDPCVISYIGDSEPQD